MQMAPFALPNFRRFVALRFWLDTFTPCEGWVSFMLAINAAGSSIFVRLPIVWFAD
jgi:hypothetical protein